MELDLEICRIKRIFSLKILSFKFKSSRFPPCLCASVVNSLLKKGDMIPKNRLVRLGASSNIVSLDQAGAIAENFFVFPGR